VPQAVKAAHQQLVQESTDQKQARLDKEARQAGPSSTLPSSTTAIRSQPSIAGFAVDKMKADAADFAIALAFAETATHSMWPGIQRAARVLHVCMADSIFMLRFIVARPCCARVFRSAYELYNTQAESAVCTSMYCSM
jgi:hypothetical protein